MIRRIKAMSRHALASACYWSRYSLRRLDGRVVIVGYHRVLSSKDRQEEFVQPGMYVDTDAFEKHVRFLREHFRIVSFAEILALWRGNDWDPRDRYCVITFDDGWLDNYTHAFPILRRYGIPATIFVATEFIGTERHFWTDDLGVCLRACRGLLGTDGASRKLRAFAARHPWLGIGADVIGEDAIESAIEAGKRMPQDRVAEIVTELAETLRIEPARRRAFLGHREMEEMSLHGVSFGSHSCRHQIMTRLEPHEIRHEVEDSRDALRRSGVNVVSVFCYPNGDADDRVVAAVRRAGYSAAVSGRFGSETRKPDDLFRLRRVSMHQDVASSTALFALRLSGVGVALERSER